MGVCTSKEARKQEDINREIEREQDKERSKLSRSVKLLLLGAGESGKSTILKQMRILRISGFDENELTDYRGAVFSHIIYCMYEMLKAMDELGIEFTDKTLEEQGQAVNEVVKKNDERKPFTDAVAKALVKLWSNDAIQQVYARRTEYQLNDSAKYFLDNLDRICKQGFLPSEEDALRVRVTTTGVVEMIFSYKSVVFRVIDVGGQRSERRKWIHHFDTVNCIVFVVALSEFNQMMREDETVNRMTDAIELFGSICNEEWFVNTGMILFLNKRDLFMEKIKTVPITIAFPDYAGDPSYEECVQFIAGRFTSLAVDRTVHVYETCATDKNQVQVVINKVTDIVINKNIQNTGRMVQSKPSDPPS